MNKQKIVITGALGYIGFELLRIYSGEAWFKEIVAIDNRFLSGRVAQISAWGITYMQGNILDPTFLKKALENADICYHLAGITDVAYSAENNSAKDKEITDVGISGTRNVLEALPEKCKIIFPSTHVVFEGYKQLTRDLTEQSEVIPQLTYSRGKIRSEKDIALSGRNYIIARLGSVYGYSDDNMRINIMPNLFSKIAATGGTISLHSGGRQLKSLVNVVDVARAFKFLAQSDQNCQTFHVSSVDLTIRQVADICREFCPDVKIVETEDQVPNEGYTISNKKLLATGFNFLHDIRISIGDMISKWTIRKPLEDSEYIDAGGKIFKDKRGVINNYELPEPINMIGLITSVPQSVRANHFHPIQEQKCLLISGGYISVTKDLSKADSLIETRYISPGNLAVIKPNVAHAMIFTKESTFLNLVNGEREHQNYGITHTIPYTLVDGLMFYNILGAYRVGCRVCANTHLEDIVSLGMSPLANSLVDNPDQSVTRQYPLELKYCSQCHNVQLSVAVDEGLMFSNYLYRSSTSEVFRRHFVDAAIQYIHEFSLDGDSVVWDIGCNDGVFLKPLVDRGVHCIGFEPAENLCQIARAYSGAVIINSYFTGISADMAILAYGARKDNANRCVDLVCASNVFAHADDVKEIVQAVFSKLKKGGVFIIEVQYLLDTITDLTFDNIYHEHVNYWSLTSLIAFFNYNFNGAFTIYRVERINTHGGSIRCFIKRQAEAPCDKIYDNSVHELLMQENASGLLNYETYQEFGRRIMALRGTVKNNMASLKKKYGRIAAYGSPAKATTALNYFGITCEDIVYTIEDNELKIGKYIPVANIPIVSKEHALNHMPDLVIVLAWNFFDSIVKNNTDITNRGTEFISIKDLYNPDMEI